MPTDEDKVKSLISMGSDITGAATGGGIGFLIGGPAGAAVGGPLGILIRRGLSDIANRVLSTREKIRVGATAWYAITKIEERRNSGDMLRDDGFFEAKGKERPGAEEIFEGVLLKAKNEHEEKKTKILGNIFANTAFNSAISVGQANHALRIAESLTYRQMCLLSLITVTEGIEFSDDDYGARKKIPYETMSLLQEMYELYNGFGLITPKDSKVMLIRGWWGMSPKKFDLTPIGERYYQLMGIEEGIPDEDIKDIARHFQLD